MLVCDHASNRFPQAMNQLGLADWVLERHVACDIGAAAVTRLLADRLNAPAILAGYSRLIVDLNRQLHTSGAFIEVSDGITVPGNIDLAPEERQDRIASFFDPYHGAITERIDTFLASGVQPAIIAIHTCTPVFNDVVREMHFGIMWDQDDRIPVPLMRQLESFEGVCVGDNEPYSGQHPDDFTIDHHAERKGLPCVGIEIRQDLVNDETGATHWTSVLGEALERVLPDVVNFKTPNTSSKNE